MGEEDEDELELPAGMEEETEIEEEVSEIPVEEVKFCVLCDKEIKEDGSLRWAQSWEYNGRHICGECSVDMYRILVREAEPP